jgi:nucleoid DNA-binding protein
LAKKTRDFPGFLRLAGCIFLVNASNLPPIRIADVHFKFLQFSEGPHKEGWQIMAKAAPAKPAAKAKAPSKSEILNNLAAATNLSRKEVSAVLDALTAEIGKALSKKGNGLYQLPGLCKIIRKAVPAKPAREGTDPRTGEKTMFKAKPASITVKVRALKNLKDMVK